MLNRPREFLESSISIQAQGCGRRQATNCYESLMTYDPVNDHKGVNILKIEKVPMEPGSSGVQVNVQCDILLEEEQFFGRVRT